MPSSKSFSDSSRESCSSVSSRATIFSSCWKAFSNSFPRKFLVLFFARAPGGSRGGQLLEPERFSLDGAAEQSFLEIHIDGITDRHLVGITKDSLPAVGSLPGNGIAARQNRKRRDRVECRRHRFERTAG